jgi:peptide/nickel transport system substrate-binding protein
LEGEPKTLNPLLATADPDLTVLALISRNLLDYDASLNLVPGLAESVEADVDRLVYTVRLRPDLVWEDGTKVTSDDVVTTIQTLVDPKTPSLNRRGFFEGFEKAESIDERTARVSFRSAVSTRRDAFNLPLLPSVRVRGREIGSSPLNRAPLSNGPYRLKRWVAGSTIELERNPRSLSGGADRVVFRIVPDSTAAFEGLRSGALDDMRLTAPQYANLKEGDKGIARLVWNELSYSYIAWNNNLPLFSDPAVRRALTSLIDRDALSRAFYGGLARSANGPLPPGLWPHDASLTPIPFDPKGAEAALEAAGFFRGEDGIRRRGELLFSFTLMLGMGSDLQRQMAETMQHSFREAGILMSIQPTEWTAFTAAVDEGRFESCVLAMNLDPNPDLFPNWHSSQGPPGGWNSVSYRNLEADALMERLRTTFDRDTAIPLYMKLQRIIRDDQPVTFLHFVPVRWGVSKRVEGVMTSPIGLSLFWPGAAGWRVRSRGPM